MKLLLLVLLSIPLTQVDRADQWHEIVMRANVATGCEALTYEEACANIRLCVWSQIVVTLGDGRFVGRTVTLEDQIDAAVYVWQSREWFYWRDR